jgi:hypothetical protein
MGITLTYSMIVMYNYNDYRVKMETLKLQLHILGLVFANALINNQPTKTKDLEVNIS